MKVAAKCIARRLSKTLVLAAMLVPGYTNYGVQMIIGSILTINLQKRGKVIGSSFMFHGLKKAKVEK
jgi:hypothetical protein